MPNTRDSKLNPVSETGTPIVETAEKKLETANHSLGGESIEDPKVEKVEEPVVEEKAPKAKKGFNSYINKNFRITYDVPNTGAPGTPAVQHSWNEGEILVDDGTKIPRSEVAKLVKDGILVSVDSAEEEED